MKFSVTALAVSAMLLSCLTESARATVITAKAATAFTNQFNGDDIYDGTDLISGWGYNGTTANLSLSGSSLVVPADGSAGTWLDLAAFSTAIPEADSYTLELSVTLAADQELAVWPARDGDNDLRLFVNTNGTGNDGDDDTFDTAANDNGTHVFRIAFEGSGNATGTDGANPDTYSLWRDGVLIDSGVSPIADGFGGGLLVGDCCGDVDNSGFTLNYVSYDTGGAFAPVPEPTTLFLSVLSAAGLLTQRRRSNK